LFSTGFFDFKGDGPVVSHWFWLYWIFTIGFTIAVYILWTILVREKAKENLPDSEKAETPPTSR
jgi:phosphotransferase system  glucose/maltose/N-acetylglucosamine-specific IIC component